MRDEQGDAQGLDAHHPTILSQLHIHELADMTELDPSNPALARAYENALTRLKTTLAEMQ